VQFLLLCKAGVHHQHLLTLKFKQLQVEGGGAVEGAVAAAAEEAAAAGAAEVDDTFGKL
jgi:hypothetical protein